MSKTIAIYISETGSDGEEGSSTYLGPTKVYGGHYTKEQTDKFIMFFKSLEELPE